MTDHDQIVKIAKELEELLEMTTKNRTDPFQIEKSKEDEKEISPEQPGTEKKKWVRRKREVVDKEADIQDDWKIPEESHRLIRPDDGLWVAFLVPIVIMIIIFAQRGIFPFGEESFLRTDMYHQYAPFFSEFNHKLSSGGNLLYSWNIGMGVNFAALYAYYLASPLNWLLVLCPNDLIIEFMTYSIVFKIGLSGLAFAYYLKKHTKRNDFGVAYFGIFYALSGYMAAYSWNIMWLDCILLFPLVALGLERLVKEKKGFLYCITLGCCILSNYYISIMICIFMILYFVALLILEKKMSFSGYLVRIFQFSLFSLLSGGLAAVVLLPEIYALQATASGDFNFPKTMESYFSIFDMLSRHISNVDTEIGLDHWPNIYCGVAVLMFFLLYLACKKIRAREKTVYCSLLLLFFASFSVNTLNFIWHGFHFPNSLPCRQSFIYIFLLLLMCYRAYQHLDTTSWKHIIIAFWGSALFVVMAEKLVVQKHFQFYVYYVALLYLALYVGILYLYKKKQAGSTTVLLLALAVVAVEAAVNTTVTSVTTTSRSSYIRDNESVEQLLELIPTDDFYRVEKVDRKTKNDGAWMNFPSVSLFSSTANADLSAFFKTLGCESSTNAYSITGSTPLVNMLFSVRYALYSSEVPENSHLTLLGQSGETWLYENLNTLPLGFMISGDFEEQWQRNIDNPVSVQNDLCDFNGTSRVFEEISVETTDNLLRFTPAQDGNYYVYVSNRKIEDITFTVSDRSKSFSNVNRGYLLDLGDCKAGEDVMLKAKETDQDLYANVYRFVPEALTELYNKLNQSPWKLENWSDTSLKGTVEAVQDGLLYTSVPYDKGWKVLLDGQEWTTRKLFDTFLTVDVPEGFHTLEFSYEPEGLRLGAAITGASIVTLLLLALAGISRNRLYRSRIDGMEEEEA